MTAYDIDIFLNVYAMDTTNLDFWRGCLCIISTPKKIVIEKQIFKSFFYTILASIR